ncbi:MAG: transglutaminase domain-containing protein [Eubacteriales bacterium]
MKNRKKNRTQALLDDLTSDTPASGTDTSASSHPFDAGNAGEGDRATDLLPDEQALRKQEKAAKKAIRKQKKKEKAERRAIRRHDNAVLYVPDRMNGFKLSIVLGYFLRFFSIAFSIFGVVVLLADSFLTTEINYWYLLLYAIVTVSGFSLIFIGRKLILAGIGILAAEVGGIALLAGSPAAFYAGGFIRVFNQSMGRLADLGFAAADSIAMPALGGLTTANPDLTYLYGGLCALITVLALIFSAFSAKRTRLLPMLLFGGGLCVICFTYNLCGSNFGIACVLAGLCSAIVLSTYDKIYAAHKHSRKSRSYSGFSSALAGILAFAVLLLPASAVKEPWSDIPLISEPMDTLRMVVTTILTGGNPKLNVMNSLIKKKSADITDMEFDEIPLFTVSSYLSRTNLYLRGWVASDFDYEGNYWEVLSDDDYQEMINQSRYIRTGLTGDEVSYLLASMFNSYFDIQNLPLDTWTGSSAYGSYYTPVDVEYTGNTGLLYILPSSYVPSVGIYQYGSRTDRYTESVGLYSDGIYQSGWLNLKKQYSVGALTPTYTDSGFPELAKMRASLYEILVPFFRNSNLNSMEDEDIRRAYLSLLVDEGYIDGSFLEREEAEDSYASSTATPSLPNYLRSPLESYLNASNRRQWVTKYIEQVSEYSDYVESFYTSYPADSVGISEISAEIKEAYDQADNDYDRVMAVIDYMILNYSYSLTPEKPSGTYESDLDSFLLETKEGYCVQFATAATLLLRSLGMPARYVQGYIAADSVKTTDDDGNVIYTSTVRDSNAHAWVEVWIDGMGWRTFEVTPQYYKSLYYIPPADPDNPDDPKQDISEILTTTTTTAPDPITTPATSETAPAVTTDPTANENESDRTVDTGTIVVTLTAFGCAILAVLLIWLLIRRSRKVAAGRKYFIERAVYGNFEESEDLDLVSGTLGDGIYDIMKILGRKPAVGESPMEFAYRVDHPKKPETPAEEKAVGRQLMWAHTFTEVTAILEKREFGGHITRDELAVMGEFLESLMQVEYRALSLHKKLWYRYILCKI